MQRVAGKTAILILAALWLPVAARAQQVRGTVRDSAAHNPLSGVVVAGLDSAGATAARAITDAEGRYAFTAASTVRRLRLIRIGYRPRDVVVAKGRAVVDVTMERLPPILETVRVSGSELCPGSTDRGAAFQLWEQARAGLLATIVARDLKPAAATTTIYESDMSPGDERIRRQTRRVKTGQTTRPFIASAAPSFFVDNGYMIEDASGRQFNAPDADVLLDESFASTHCFHLQQADAAHPGQSGLAFAPISGRDDLVDVRGVIWIDNTAPQVRSLDFAYTSLEPAAVQAKAGGHIEFRTMPNGVSFIERWNLRLPLLETVSTSFNSMRRPPPTGKRQDRFDVRVSEIIEAGGIVLDARWDDGQFFQEPRSFVTGLITRRKSGAPVAGAVVTLAGTADSTVSDNAGRFRIAAIPGKYTVQVSDTTLATFVAPRNERVRADVARGTVASVHVEMPPIRDVVSDICRGQPMPDSSVIIVGSVARADAPPPSGARVHATWQSDYEQNPASGIVIHERSQDSEIDDDGRFVVCGVVRERPIKLVLKLGDSHLADTTVTAMNVGLTMPVDWRIGAAAAKAQPPAVARAAPPRNYGTMLIWKHTP